MSEQPKFRQLEGFWSVVVKVLFSAVPIFGLVYCLHILQRLGIQLLNEQYLALGLGCLLSACFLTTPGAKRCSRLKVPWYDALLAFLSLIPALHITIFYPKLVFSRGFITPTVVILGIIALILVLEASRRLFGWALVSIGVIGILYARCAYLIPGIWGCREISWGRLVTYLYLDPGGIYGVAISVGLIVVFGFIFFGRFLFRMGTGQLMSELAISMLGKYRGGAGKATVLASAAFGTMTGSAAADVAMVGTVTIPLMKKAGYPSVYAAALQAASSVGAVFLPPVMGAVAFIMAEFLEVPYPKVAIAAAIPACLYFMAIFIQLDLTAIRHDLKGIPSEKLPSIKETIKKGWYFLFPVAVLVYCLFVLYWRPETAALWAAGVALIILFFMNVRTIWSIPRQLLAILEATGLGLLELGVVCGVANIVIGVISLTGLGITLSQLLISMSGGHTLILLALAALGAIIMGMGMPIAASYIMIIMLMGPALAEAGINLLAAHLFVMYFAGLSFLTPPVCIAAYVSASMAGCDPMQTGFKGVGLGIVAYIVPFIFVLNPALILIGSIGDTVIVIVTTTLAVIFLAAAIAGYLFGELNVGKRLWLGLWAILFLIPSFFWKVVALSMIVILLLWQWQIVKHASSNRS
jgi:TRAP transporter 4TM/12TM fusion protein